jgi:serine/threonine protein phosphatase PrpC
MQFLVSADTQINNRNIGKPNEDLILADQVHQVYFVLDGITRVHREYGEQPGYSAALEAGQIFSSTAHSYMLAHTDLPAEQLLRQAAAAGNRALRPFRQQRSADQWQFYPGTLGILALVRAGVLHYVYNGDCMATLIRKGQKYHFARQEQTKKLEEMHISKAERYAIYCNHPEHPMGYGIFNGDEEMSQLLGYGSLPLFPGDVILLCTDGLGEYVLRTDGNILSVQTPRQIIEASTIYDIPPYATYADDKSILRIAAG